MIRLGSSVASAPTHGTSAYLLPLIVGLQLCGVCRNYRRAGANGYFRVGRTDFQAHVYTPDLIALKKNIIGHEAFESWPPLLRAGTYPAAGPGISKSPFSLLVTSSEKIGFGLGDRNLGICDHRPALIGDGSS